jgi:tetratricopeptide (TPR) repeat protein
MRLLALDVLVALALLAPQHARAATLLAQAPAAAAPQSPATPSQAVVEKLGQGDRLFLAGDYRNALFAYQDAVHMQPRYAAARVRLGRTYLAMRYPDMAIEQAEEALAEEPGSAEARKLLEEAKAAPPRPQAPATAAAPAAGAAASLAGAPAKPAANGSPPPGGKGTRVYKLPAEPDATPGQVAAPAPPQTQVALAAPAAAAQAPAAPESLDPASAAQHYRNAIGLLQSREWSKAVTELSLSIAADPKLAVAYSARGSAHFGLGKYQEAAEDYRQAIVLDPKLGTPLYGLAECYRVAGDPKNAAEMYDRYAKSSAPDVRDDLRTVAAKRAQELR